MKLLEFYKSILQDVNVIIDENDYLKLETKNGESFIVRKKKNILLPTKNVLQDFYIQNENNEMVPKGLIFNPIKENINENIGIDLLRDCMVAKLEQIILAFGNNLIIALSNPELQNELDIDLSMCIANIRKNVPGMKNNAKISDETMIKNWTKLITEQIESENGLITLLISSDRTKKYTKVGKLLINIFDTLNSGDEEEKVKINKVTVRPKDKIVFKEIIKLLIPELDDNGLFTIGTNDLDCPTFILALNIFYSIANRYKKYMLSLETADTVTAQSVVIYNSFSKESIDKINETFGVEKNMLPSESELNTTKKVLSINNVNSNNIEKKELSISNTNTKVKNTNVNKAFAPTLNQVNSSFSGNINMMNNMGTFNPNFNNRFISQPNNFQPVPQVQPVVQPLPQPVAQPINKNKKVDEFEIKPLSSPMVCQLNPHLNDFNGAMRLQQQQQQQALQQREMQLKQQMQMLQQQQAMFNQQQQMLYNQQQMNNMNMMNFNYNNGFNSYGMNNTIPQQGMYMNNMNPGFNNGFNTGITNPNSNFTSF